MPRFNKNILGKIKRAQSLGEIDALLAESAMFEEMSDKTRRRQERIAQRRREELGDQAK